MIKVSVIIPTLESYEMVRRQMLYMTSLNIPEWMEVIIIDDGSVPPISEKVPKIPLNFEFTMLRREDLTPWTIPRAINYGLKHCSGEYVMMMGIDHMLSREFIEYAESSEDQYATFMRHYALLDKYGGLIKLNKVLGRISKNWWKKSLGDRIGNWDESKVGRYGLYEDHNFRDRMLNSGVIKTLVPEQTFIYMIPEKGDPRRPLELFHHLPYRLSKYESKIWPRKDAWFKQQTSDS